MSKTAATYRFTYFLSGTDNRGTPITKHTTYYLSLRASTQGIAERKLRGQYFKSVQVNIQSVEVTDEGQI